jgi:hypothetical protein
MPEAPSLRELERQLFALIRAPEGVPRALKGRRAPQLTRRRLQQLVRGDDRLSAVDRLDIYADMYFLRLLEVLREVFPRLAAALGEQDFSALATDYLEANPSRHPSLRHLGQRLPAFLRRPDSDRPRCPTLPVWAPDLAALEWQRYDVFDEVDARVLTLARLQAHPPEAFAELPIALVPAHRRLPVDQAVEELWRALSRGDSAPEIPPRSGQLLVWRQENMVYHRRIDAAERDALEAAARGSTFGTVCEQIAEGGEKDPAQAAFRLLAGWIDDGLLVDGPNATWMTRRT